MKVDRSLGEFRAQDEVLYLWSGNHVRAVSPGLEMIMADVYWLRTIQYFGGQRIMTQNKNFDLLRPLVDITVTLDPRFEIAYRYGAIFLAEGPPAGAGRPLDGIAVLHKGTQALPYSWRLREELGFFYFTFQNDPRRASEVLLETAEIPGAPFWMRSLAASILVKGGERQAARQIWRAMYSSSEEGALKDNARRHLLYLDALDVADQVQLRVQEFTRRFGRHPERLDELRTTGLLSGPATDPSGTAFDYDRATGKVGISRYSQAWRPQ